MSDGYFTAAAPLRRRHIKGRLARAGFILATASGVVVLFVLLLDTLQDGWAWLDLQFLTSPPSRLAGESGIQSALWGSVWLIVLTAAVSVPIGVAAALYLEEYSRPGKLSTLIEVNIANLAGVPSIVYGMLGGVVFVKTVALGESVLTGALTLSLLILPIIITATREAVRAVPDAMRHAAFAIGATEWQTVRHHVLPAALPGILTGIILALSRAIGETAPLIMIGALTYVRFVPQNPLDEFTALPIQIYAWISKPQSDFHSLAAAGILVLLAVLLLMNGVAVWIRHRAQRKARW